MAVTAAALSRYRRGWQDYLDASRFPNDEQAQAAAAEQLNAIDAAATLDSALACLRVLSTRVMPVSDDPALEATVCAQLGAGAAAAHCDADPDTATGAAVLAGEAELATRLMSAARQQPPARDAAFSAAPDVVCNRAMIITAQWLRGQVSEGADGDRLSRDLVDAAVRQVADPQALGPDYDLAYIQRPLRLTGDATSTADAVRRIVDVHRSLDRFYAGRTQDSDFLLRARLTTIFESMPAHVSGVNADVASYIGTATLSDLGDWAARGGPMPTMGASVASAARVARNEGWTELAVALTDRTDIFDDVDRENVAELARMSRRSGPVWAPRCRSWLMRTCVSCSPRRR